LSGDGNKMWIAYGSYDSSHMLGSIDLETLTVLPELALSFQPQSNPGLTAGPIKCRPFGLQVASRKSLALSRCVLYHLLLPEQVFA